MNARHRLPLLSEEGRLQGTAPTFATVFLASEFEHDQTRAGGVIVSGQRYVLAVG